MKEAFRVSKMRIIQARNARKAIDRTMSKLHPRRGWGFNSHVVAQALRCRPFIWCLPIRSHAGSVLGCGLTTRKEIATSFCAQRRLERLHPGCTHGNAVLTRREAA